MARVLLPGKDDCLHQPTPLPILKPYRSAITLDDLLGDRQPQPGARNEFSSAPIVASCQAATVPVALTEDVTVWGTTFSTETASVAADTGVCATGSGEARP